MCRWLAYTGSPVLLTDVLYTPAHSLIDQSLHSGSGRRRPTATASASAGMTRRPSPGCSAASSRPGMTRTCASSRGTSARRCSSRTSARRSGRPFSRPTAIRSGMAAGCGCTTGSSTASRRSSATWCSRSTNRCFPRSRGRPTARSCSTWRSASAWKTIRPRRSRGPSGWWRPAGRARGVQYPFQGTIATTDGESLWAFRYSSEGKSRSLFFSRDIRAVRQLAPDREILREVSDDTRLVVSEPVGDLPGAWVEMPEASYGVVSKGGDQLLPFIPKPPNGR